MSGEVARGGRENNRINVLGGDLQGVDAGGCCFVMNSLMIFAIFFIAAQAINTPARAIFNAQIA